MSNPNNHTKFNELLKGICKSAALVLDFGCGTGSLPLNFFNRGCIIIGIDNELQSLQLNKTAIRKIAGNLYYPPLSNVRFDLVILKYTLEHLQYPEIVIKKLSEFLGSNQFVYVVVPKYYAFQDVLYRFLGRCSELFGVGKQAHIQKFTFGTLCRMFYDNGFVMVEFSEESAGLSFLDKTPARKKIKIIVELFVRVFLKLFNKNLLERNEMHFIFCKFD